MPVVNAKGCVIHIYGFAVGFRFKGDNAGFKVFCFLFKVDVLVASGTLPFLGLVGIAELAVPAVHNIVAVVAVDDAVEGFISVNTGNEKIIQTLYIDNADKHGRRAALVAYGNEIVKTFLSRNKIGQAVGYVLALFKKRLIIRGGIAGKVASVCYKRAVREKHIYAGIKGGAFKLVDVQRNHLTTVEIVVDRKQLADGAELFYFIVELCGYFIIKGGDIFLKSIKASLLFIGNYSIV